MFNSFREIIVLNFIVVATPFAIIFGMYYLQNGPVFNSFYGVSLTFLVGLVLFHLFSFIFRNLTSENLPKHMDYVYLFIAGIGLFGAAEITQSAAEQSAKKYINEVYLARRNILDLLNRDHKKFCQGAPKSAECKAYLSESRPISDSLFKEHADVLVDDYDPDEKKSLQSEPLNPHWRWADVLVAPSDETFRRNFDSVLPAIGGIKETAKLAEKTTALSIETKSQIQSISNRLNELLDGLINLIHSPILTINKVFGFLLLASALALRITKVSVEIQKWHAVKKSGPNKNSSEEHDQSPPRPI